MKSEKEIRETLMKIDQIMWFIAESGSSEELEHERVGYASNVSDTCDWILDEISTERFLSENYVDTPFLEKMAKDIEDRTGEKLKDCEL